MFKNGNKMINMTLPAVAILIYKQYNEIQVEHTKPEYRLPGTVQMLFVTLLTSVLYFDYDE